MFSRTRMPSAAIALLGLAALFSAPVSAAEVVLRFGSINTENTAPYDKVLVPFQKAVEEESDRIKARRRIAIEEVFRVRRGQPRQV